MSDPDPANEKKPYTAPKLRRLGSIQELALVTLEISAAKACGGRLRDG